MSIAELTVIIDLAASVVWLAAGLAWLLLNSIELGEKDR